MINAKSGGSVRVIARSGMDRCIGRYVAARQVSVRFSPSFSRLGHVKWYGNSQAA